MQIKNMTQHVIGKLAPGQTRDVESAEEQARVRKSAAFRAGHLVEGNPPMPAIMYEPLGVDSDDQIKRSRLRIDMETDRQVLARWAQDLEAGGEGDRLRAMIRSKTDHLLDLDTRRARGEQIPADDLSHVTRAATRQPVPPPLPERRDATNEGPPVVPQAQPDGPPGPPVPPPPPPPPPPEAPGKPQVHKR